MFTASLRNGRGVTTIGDRDSMGKVTLLLFLQVFGLVLLVLCVVDAVLLFQKISLGAPRGRNTPAK